MWPVFGCRRSPKYVSKKLKCLQCDPKKLCNRKTTFKQPDVCKKVIIMQNVLPVDLLST